MKGKVILEIEVETVKTYSPDKKANNVKSVIEHLLKLTLPNNTDSKIVRRNV